MRRHIVLLLGLLFGCLTLTSCAKRTHLCPELKTCREEKEDVLRQLVAVRKDRDKINKDYIWLLKFHAGLMKAQRSPALLNK